MYGFTLMLDRADPIDMIHDERRARCLHLLPVLYMFWPFALIDMIEACIRAWLCFDHSGANHA